MFPQILYFYFSRILDICLVSDLVPKDSEMTLDSKRVRGHGGFLGAKSLVMAFDLMESSTNASFLLRAYVCLYEPPNSL